jgi:monoamine oxidase/SAM-dependent methyltransferase
MDGIRDQFVARPSAETDSLQFRVAIVGGGPGGMFSAWQLANKAGTACKITIYEASERLGGKILTKSFAGAGLYEAGVAEIYDYSGLGPDPLRELIEKDLDLRIRHIAGGACVLGDKILPDAEALAEHFGPAAREGALAFRARCAELLSPTAFYKSAREGDNAHPWLRRTGEEILDAEIPDHDARRYIRAMTHSDVAAPPHLTSGLNFLKNVLMDVDGYMSVYSVLGGNEEIVRRLAEQLDAEVRLNAMVRSVEPLPDGTYRLVAGVNGSSETIIADYVILALPLTALSIMDWRSPALHHAMVDHVRHFDRPGHYLRASLLFARPFWREHVQGAWWMLDAFDGCCVYDEGARHELGSWGVLGFLIAGNAALGLANMADEEIEQLCLDALPHELGDARGLLIDRRVHRWMASVNAIPGGLPVRGLSENHRPDADRLPGVVVVGDYIFDATLNGVLDSADAATEMILADILRRRRASPERARPGRDETAPWQEFFEPDFLADMLPIVWGAERDARILVAGSGAGAGVAALRKQGLDAYGLEADPQVHALTPIDLRPFNLTGDLTSLPFADNAFDVVLEACLCQAPRASVGLVAAELRRVARAGVFLGSVASDLALDLIERHDLLARVQTFMSRWEWSELLLAHGFDLALTDPAKLESAWRRAVIANAGPGQWCDDSESLLYCFYVTTGQRAHEEDRLVAAERAAIRV